MFLHGENVTLHRYVGTTKNEHGQRQAQYTDIELEDVAVFMGATSFPGAVSEIDERNSLRINSGARVIIPSDVVVTSQDRMTVRGVEYDVNGEPIGDRINPFTGHSFGTKIILRKDTGG